MKTLTELRAVYDLPLPELLYRAMQVHRAHHDPADVQRCALLSIKTGGCPEDCGYCSQSAHYKTGVKAEPLMSAEEVRERATRAKALGATRFCMGAAWREVKDGPQFESVLQMVREVRGLGMEACVTLGMLETEEDRLLLLAELAALDPPPESIPINCLMPIPGTPLEQAEPVDSIQLVR